MFLTSITQIGGYVYQKGGRKVSLLDKTGSCPYNKHEVICMRDVGKNIRKLREAKGMTQETMAEALFVTRQTVSNYETGRSRPDVDMLVRIGEILGTDVNTLIYGPTTPEKKTQAIRGLLIGLAVLAVLFIAYIILAPWAKELGQYRYIVLPSYCVKLLLSPMLMLVFGWVLMQGAALLLGADQLKKSWVKYARIALIAFFVFLAVEIVPFLGWQIHNFIELEKLKGQEYSFSSQYPYIPLLQQILMLTINYPAIYTLLGALAWLFGIPKHKE